MKAFLHILGMLGAVVLSSSAENFSVRYIAAARQLCFSQPLNSDHAYRLVVITFGASGSPSRELTANEANYTKEGWFVESGQEMLFKDGTLDPVSSKKTSGLHPELALQLEKPATSDPHIKAIGSMLIFAEQELGPNCTNLSVFTANGHTSRVNYCFARRADINSTKGKTRIIMKDVLLINSWADSGVPPVALADEMSFAN